MSDLLEDQKIHYIVKDYRRMYNENESLLAALKEAKTLLEQKDRRIALLEKQLSNGSNPTISSLRQLVNQFGTIQGHTKKGKEMVEKIIEHIINNSEEPQDEVEEDYKPKFQQLLADMQTIQVIAETAQEFEEKEEI